MTVNTIIDVTTNQPIQGLGNYTVRRDSVPLDPTNSSMAIPSASFQISVTDDSNPEELMSRSVIVTDRAGQTIHTEIVDYSLSEGTNQASLDTVGLFERLNTEQTCLPYVDSFTIEPAKVLESWAQECGVFKYPVPGYPRTYVSAFQPLGYEKDSKERWITPDGLTYKLTYNGTASAPFLGPSQTIMFGTYFSTVPAAAVTRERLTYYFPQAEGKADIGFTLEHRGTQARVLQDGVLIGAVTLNSLPAPAYNSWDIHLLASVAPATPNKVDFTLRAVTRTPGATNSTATFSHVTGSVLLGNKGYNRIVRSGGDEAWFRAYVSENGTLPTEPAEARFDSTYDAILPASVNCVQGFTGNVWDKMREFCSIYNLDLVLMRDAIQVQKMVTVMPDSPLPVAQVQKSNVRKRLSKRTRARKVEVVQNTLRRPMNVNPILLWSADTVYNLERGEVLVETVQTDATFLGLMQPMAMSGISFPVDNLTLSSYVVTGADGYIIDPQWWNDNGGSITVAPTRNSGEIEITMKAPTVVSVRAPYRISEGQADRPALHITGNGVVSKKSTLEIYTGSPKAAQEVGVTFDSPFVNDIETVYRVGNRLANFYGGTTAELSYSVPLNNGYEGTDRQGKSLPPLGYTAETAHIYHRGAIYRNSAIASGPFAYQVEAEFGTTIAHGNEYWKDKTVRDFDNYFAGKLVRDVNRAPLPQHLS